MSDDVNFIGWRPLRPRARGDGLRVALVESECRLFGRLARFQIGLTQQVHRRRSALGDRQTIVFPRPAAV